MSKEMTLNMAPLVSVMIPCYNAAKTLPMALASLLAQTYKNWEAIIIDDGSTDRPIDVVNAANDMRIRFHRFERNRGRGAARQQALNMSRGEYLCMVDADDWIYPWKIERQVEIMRKNPSLSVLSTGMMLIDRNNTPLAVRTTSDSDTLQIHDPISSPAMPPFAHGPSMIRTSAIKDIRYDTKLAIVEDVDFLLQIIMKHSFGVSSEVTYVYCEMGSYSLSKIIRSYEATNLMFSKYKSKHRITVLKQRIILALKSLTYRLAAGLHVDQLLVRQRSKSASAAQLEDFYRARSIVYCVGRNLYEGTPFLHLFSS